MPLKSCTMESPEWGRIRIVVNRRAKHIIMRAMPDAIRITVPPAATAGDIENALKRHGDALKKKQEQQQRRFIDTHYRIDNENFCFSIAEHSGKNFIMSSKGRETTLLCPTGTDYAKREDWLREVVKKAVTKAAKKMLPTRLQALAEKHGLKYSKCSIRDTHTRWGSCNTKGNISLSIYIMLLPDRLVNYILLHELCHTVHMNHGDGFWKLLDELCGTDSKALRRELKRHRTEI